MNIDSLLKRFGLIRRQQVKDQLDTQGGIAKRLDEHRETVELLAQRGIFDRKLDPQGVLGLHGLCFRNLVDQDDYLVGLFELVYGCPPDSPRVRGLVRDKPAILNEPRHVHI